MDELIDIKLLNYRFDMLKNKIISIRELNLLVEDVFLYMKDKGFDEILIKNLIESIVESIINAFSSGILTYDDYVEYVEILKYTFSHYSGFAYDEVEKYFDKYGLTDDSISFHLYLELLECNDSLEDIIKAAELEGLTVLELINKKIAFWENKRDVAKEANSLFINEVNSELEKRMNLTKNELISILELVSPEFDFDKSSYFKEADLEYVEELKRELDYMDYCSNRKDSELLYEGKEILNKLAKSSNLSDYEVYIMRRKVKIISSVLLEKSNISVNSLENYSNDIVKDNINDNLYNNNKFKGISTKKLYVKLNELKRSISKADSKISKYEKKKKLVDKSRFLKKLMPHFKEKKVIDVISLDDTNASNCNNKTDVVVNADKVKVEKRVDLLYKSLATIGGFGLGIVLSSCPGVGLFRMTASGVKLSSSLYGIIKKKFPNSLISKVGSRLNKKIDAKWKKFSFNHSFVSNIVDNVNYKCNNILSNKIINCFITGLASGYFVGNLWELLKGFSNFMGDVIDKFSNIELGFNFDFLINDVSNNEVILNGGLNSDEFSRIDNVNNFNRRPNPFKVKPSILIDDFSSVGETVFESVSTIGEGFLEIGNHINVESIDYGFVSSDGIKAVKLNTSIAGDLIVDKFVTLSNGEVMVHLKQLTGEGYAWFKKTVLDEHLLKSICNNVGKAK